MAQRPAKHSKSRRETSTLLGPVALLVLLLVIALGVYAVIWVSHYGLRPPPVKPLEQPSGTPTTPADGWANESVRAIGLAHISAALESATLEASRLPEFHTFDEVFGRIANPVVTAKERINELQHGSYPELNVKLGSVMDEPLNGKVTPYAEMTRPEKLLLYADWVGTKQHDEPVYDELISRMNTANLPAITGYGMLDAVWNAGDAQEFYKIYTKSNGEKQALQALLSAEWLPRFSSPVTLRFFEPWHKEWAAGQGYIFEVTDEKERKRLVSALLDLQVQQGIRELEQLTESRKGNAIRPETIPPKPEDTMEFYKFYYYRVYGAMPGTLLAEGIEQVASFQAQQHRWEPQLATKK
jgi:hypothetical protein